MEKPRDFTTCYGSSLHGDLEHALRVFSMKFGNTCGASIMKFSNVQHQQGAEAEHHVTG